jgi:hypothetical protein
METAMADLTHHQWTMIIGGIIAGVIVFLRGELTGDSGRVDRPDEERVDCTSSEGDGRSWRPRKSGTLYRPGSKGGIEQP